MSYSWQGYIMHTLFDVEQGHVMTACVFAVTLSIALGIPAVQILTSSRDD